MAISSSSYILTFFISFLITTTQLALTNSQPLLNSAEQESVYRLLESLNSDIPWRTLFPDDLCSSAPHGVVCGYSALPTATFAGTLNILELNFGYVSDHNPNPPCSPNSTIHDPFIFSSFPYLRKLFFYNCFTTRPVSLDSLLNFGSSSLEELVLIQNPGLFGSLTGSIGKLTGLKRLVITGTNVSGEIPGGFGGLLNLEEATFSGNGFAGTLPENVTTLKNLKILDLSRNGFSGELPATIGKLENLMKLDLGSNLFSGEIPASIGKLRNLELLDLSYNRFSNSGIPVFLSEMGKLKGLYLSGNELGGVIPDIWENLRGINGIGLSGVGLFGNIPSSIGVFLGNLTYLGLDNNHLSGGVPLELERLAMVNELNLKNNNLSGRLPFSAKFVSRVGRKLRIEGNPELCVDVGAIRSFSKVGELKVCNNRVANSRFALVHVSSSSSSLMGHQFLYLVMVFLLALLI